MYNELIKNGYSIAYSINCFKELVGSEGIMMKSVIFSPSSTVEM